MKIKVLLIEDHRDYREVIEIALTDLPDIELTSQFGTAEIALRSITEGQRQHLPGVILLDLNLPGMSGLEALPLIKQALPETGVIVLTQSESYSDIMRAITLGAAGYLLKSSSHEDIVDAIRVVQQGGSPLDSGVASYILDFLKKTAPKAPLKESLTKRELEILHLLADGFLKKQISDKLNISYTTVDTHVGHIYTKLEVKNAPSAVNEAHRLGLL